MSDKGEVISDTCSKAEILFSKCSIPAFSISDHDVFANANSSEWMIYTRDRLERVCTIPGESYAIFSTWPLELPRCIM